MSPRVGPTCVFRIAVDWSFFELTAGSACDHPAGPGLTSGEPEISCMFSDLNGAHWPHSEAVHKYGNVLLGGDASRYKRRLGGLQ
jgi:hypothetical protein